MMATVTNHQDDEGGFLPVVDADAVGELQPYATGPHNTQNGGGAHIGFEEVEHVAHHHRENLGEDAEAALAFSSQEVVPGKPNIVAMVEGFWNNAMWRHEDVFWALCETVLMAFLGTFGAGA